MLTHPRSHAEQEASAMRLLFVCLGNICRSPTAEGVMRSLVAEAGLGEAIELDSAGTGSWHVGSPPDRAGHRRRALAGDRAGGQRPSGLTGGFRGFRSRDRDGSLEHARASATGAAATRARQGEAAARVRPASAGSEDLDVPDPYYGAPGGFDEVLDLVQAACAGLLGRDPRRAEPVGDAGRRAGMTLPPGASQVRQIGGGDINEAFRVLLADGQRGVREDARGRRPGRVSGRGGRSSLAGRAGGLAHAAGARCRRPLPGARVDRAGSPGLRRRRGARAGARRDPRRGRSVLRRS